MKEWEYAFNSIDAVIAILDLHNLISFTNSYFLKKYR